ncbi:malate dehydrogenase [Candidatus Dependentiae bacterium]|nr:malate dehydrogenase [Candidatus Dependentiae bacterium]
MNKVSVIGAGNVGATIAYIAASKGLGKIILYDIVDGMPQGKGLDMNESSPIENFDSIVTGTNNIEDIKGSDLIAITAGLARKPGMSREDLQKKNADIIKGIAENIKKYAPNAIVIMVTNPVDVMSYHVWKITGFPKERVMGQAGVLDSARLKFFIAEELGVSIEDISLVMLGGHGDSMVPLMEYATVSGIPISKLIDKDKIDAMVQRARKGGAEIVALLKTGSAFYAPAQATVEMMESILNNRKRVLPTSVYLDGQYGINGVFIGIPVVLGRNGIEKIFEIELDDNSLKSLQASADIYKKQIELL